MTASSGEHVDLRPVLTEALRLLQMAHDHRPMFRSQQAEVRAFLNEYAEFGSSVEQP